MEFKYRIDFSQRDPQQLLKDLETLLGHFGLADELDNPLNRISLHFHVSGPGVDRNFAQSWRLKSLVDMASNSGFPITGEFGYQEDPYSKGIVREFRKDKNRAELRQITIPIRDAITMTPEVSLSKLWTGRTLRNSFFRTPWTVSSN